jgi:hypothetical protein
MVSYAQDGAKLIADALFKLTKELDWSIVETKLKDLNSTFSMKTFH